MRRMATRAVCVLLSTALVVTQTAGCAQAPKVNAGAGTRIPVVPASDLATRQPDPKLDVRLAGTEVLLFGRLEVVSNGAGTTADLWNDSALFLTADDAPTQPIPRWPTTSLKRASVPFNPSRGDGRFQIVAPAGTYRLQVVYRNADVGWLAIVPAVRIEATKAGEALYVGVLRVEIDPQAVVEAKRSQTAKAPLRIQIVDDYAADYGALTSSQAGAANLPVGSAMMRPDTSVDATALLSTNTAAESHAKSHSVVKGILMGIVLVPLFVAAIALAVLSGGNLQLGN
jgi:hypothetical protein